MHYSGFIGAILWAFGPAGVLQLTMWFFHPQLLLVSMAGATFGLLGLIPPGIAFVIHTAATRGRAGFYDQSTDEGINRNGPVVPIIVSVLCLEGARLLLCRCLIAAEVYFRRNGQVLYGCRAGICGLGIAAGAGFGTMIGMITFGATAGAAFKLSKLGSPFTLYIADSCRALPLLLLQGLGQFLAIAGHTAWTAVCVVLVAAYVKRQAARELAGLRAGGEAAWIGANPPVEMRDVSDDPQRPLAAASAEPDEPIGPGSGPCALVKALCKKAPPRVLTYQERLLEARQAAPELLGFRHDEGGEENAHADDPELDSRAAQLPIPPDDDEHDDDINEEIARAGGAAPGNVSPAAVDDMRKARRLLRGKLRLRRRETAIAERKAKLEARRLRAAQRAAQAEDSGSPAEPLLSGDQAAAPPPQEGQAPPAPYGGSHSESPPRVAASATLAVQPPPPPPFSYSGGLCGAREKMIMLPLTRVAMPLAAVLYLAACGLHLAMAVTSVANVAGESAASPEGFRPGSFDESAFDLTGRTSGGCATSLSVAAACAVLSVLLAATVGRADWLQHAPGGKLKKNFESQAELASARDAATARATEALAVAQRSGSAPERPLSAGPASHPVGMSGGGGGRRPLPYSSAGGAGSVDDL